jgi:hypothetical protein
MLGRLWPLESKSEEIPDNTKEMMKKSTENLTERVFSTLLDFSSSRELLS